ncbi:MAG TPA: transcription antitermination factor NusB [Clostridiales bacterium]|nr:transcription antitermination factor NusB [Clostridiales bacterium]
MAAIKRRDAREEVFRLLFETEFHGEMSPEDIYRLAMEDRDFEDDRYIRDTYFGVREKREELDAIIARHANGWRTDRIAPVSRNILRLCVYEMKWGRDVPVVVALNEAIELDKRFDDPKAKAFVNGVLNGVKNELEAESAKTAAQDGSGEDKAE